VIDALRPIADACDLSIPAEHRRRVAFVGAGGIVATAHLPAYRKAGLEIVGVYDVDRAKAQAFARDHALARTYSSLDELCADEAVEVVDVAVTPWSQDEIVRAAIAAGKHVLAQKPLALQSATAEELVRFAEEHRRWLAVNQQLRFDEGVAAAREMVRRGWIGEPLALELSVDIFIEWTSWMNDAERLQLWYHAIHELDAVRSILGDPHTVWCAAAARPGQRPRGETRVLAGMVYAGELRAMLHVNSENLTGDPTATFRIDGTEGAIRGRLGRFYACGRGEPDTVDVFSRSLPTDGWLRYPATTRWFPDAFIGPMRSLLAAIATGVPPATGGRDNLGTLRLIEALYRSIATGQTQRLADGG
jgi:predicted dehydrogenase